MTPATTCATHPGVILPAMIACPLCAQEARQRAYAEQRAKWLASCSTPSGGPLTAAVVGDND